MRQKSHIILGLLVGIPLILGILHASVPYSTTSVKSAATTRAGEATVSPIAKAPTKLSKISIVPTVTPTPKPTVTPAPTVFIAPTQYIRPTTPPTNESGLSNDNYYTNVNGNQVHSPAYSAAGSVPAGATAKCNDGTYSFSQHHSGTCSGHGGVAQWL